MSHDGFLASRCDVLTDDSGAHVNVKTPIRRVRTRRLLVAVLAVILSNGGCTLFHHGSTLFEHVSRKLDDSDGVIPRIPRAADTVQLELVFVERPADDPLLSEGQLWAGLDMVGDMDPIIRKRLLSNGIRVGHSSPTPNRAIETLLGLMSENAGTAAPIDPRKLTGRRVVRPSGGDTIVQTGPLRQAASVKIVTDDGVRMKDFHLSRTIMRVKAERLQKGWARLEFLPEIHHGEQRYRPISSGNGWEGGTAQKVHRLYSQRFSVTLNVGDMAVITADNAMPESLGGSFFMAGDGGERIQRILIVRLSDIRTSKAVLSK